MEAFLRGRVLVVVMGPLPSAVPHTWFVLTEHLRNEYLDFAAGGLQIKCILESGSEDM